MNILLDQFPTKIEVNNTIYNVNSNFRDCLNIIIALEDKELTIYEKIEIVIKLLYVENIPDSDIEEAYIKATKFLDCGEEQKKPDNQDDDDDEDNQEDFRLYSFTKDAKYIYSAIKQTHRIDLESIEYLHWWKFVYLFLDIDKECFFSQILYYRKQKCKGKLTKEDYAIWYEMREILDLDYLSDEQQEKSEFEILLEAGNNKNG